MEKRTGRNMGLSLDEWLSTIEDADIKKELIRYRDWAQKQPDARQLIDTLFYGTDLEVAEAFMRMNGGVRAEQRYLS